MCIFIVIQKWLLVQYEIPIHVSCLVTSTYTMHPVLRNTVNLGTAGYIYRIAVIFRGGQNFVEKFSWSRGINHTPIHTTRRKLPAIRYVHVLVYVCTVIPVRCVSLLSLFPVPSVPPVPSSEHLHLWAGLIGVRGPGQPLWRVAWQSECGGVMW